MGPIFQGFLRYDSVDLINVERTLAYVAAGIRPPGWEIPTQEDCTGLGEALGDDPYRTPVYDQPPWYTLTDPATHGFAGILPVDITGLEGSTYSGEAVENLGDGGTVATLRRTSKTLQATAILIGVDEDSLHVGLEWLTGVLLRQCTDTSLPATLETFTMCPAIDATEDTDAALVPVTVALDDPGWYTRSGIWDYAGTFTVVGAAPGSLTPDDYDGGGPTDSGTVIDGGTPDGAGSGGPIDGGIFVPVDPFAVLALPSILDCLSHVAVAWHLNTDVADDTVTVQPAVVSPTGEVLWVGDSQDITGVTTINWTYDNAPWGAWRPALLTTAPGLRVTSVTVSTHPDVDVAECLRPFRRTMTRVKCVSAPQVTAVYDTGEACDGAIWQVEWTWVAEDPFRYLDPVTVATGVHLSATAPVFAAPGVSATYTAGVTVGSTDCPVPDTASGSCAIDPTLPAFTAPPVAPVIGRTTPFVPTSWRRSLLSLDPPVVPNVGQGALTLTLTNGGTTKRGVRYRIWRQDDPDFATHDECGFETEGTIDYIDPNAVLVIDTIGSTVTAICDDGSLADARGVMHGPYGGAFLYPTIGCGQRTFIAVDVPTGQNDLTWGVSYAAREG